MLHRKHLDFVSHPHRLSQCTNARGLTIDSLSPSSGHKRRLTTFTRTEANTLLPASLMTTGSLKTQSKAQIVAALGVGGAHMSPQTTACLRELVK